MDVKPEQILFIFSLSNREQKHIQAMTGQLPSRNKETREKKKEDSTP